MYPYAMNQPSMMAGQSFPSGNPYLDRLQAMQQPNLARYEIIHVNGENGARAWRMAPNSQCLLLDDTNPIVWLAQTDGAGYPTLTPYTITPYQAQPAPDYNSMESRIKRLEDLIYGQSNSASVGQGPDTNAGTAQSAPAAPAVPAIPAADDTGRSAGKGK